MLTFCFCYIWGSSQGGHLCILQSENTAHPYTESPSLSPLLSLKLLSHYDFPLLQRRCSTISALPVPVNPKNINPEQEVFAKRDPSYQHNRTHDKNSNKQSSIFFRPHIIQMVYVWGVGGKIGISM